MKKYCVAKILKGIWERFLYEKYGNYNSYKFSYKSTFITLWSFHKNQKQESNFQQAGALVTRNSFAFCLQRVCLYFKYIPNSIGFYKRFFLDVTLACIIVPWYTGVKTTDGKYKCQERVISGTENYVESCFMFSRESECSILFGCLNALLVKQPKACSFLQMV